MKQILAVFILLFTLHFVSAQDDSKWPEVDPSVMDMEYYPSNIAYRNYLKGDERNSSPQVRLVYSRPAKKGRKIFGELVPYGEVWRMGANEANEITFYQAVEVGGDVLKSGTYTLFSKVAEEGWTVYFSNQKGMWGSKDYDEKQIAASVTVPSLKMRESQELLSMTFQEIDDRTAHLVIQWDKTQVQVPIKFNPILFSDADKSPMDRVQYPKNSAFTNYLEGEARNTKPQIQVTYSRPYKNEREIFGGLLKNGEIWRIGANQSTEIIFYQDVEIEGTPIKQGKYVMYAELGAQSWNIIFSKDYPAWGPANRDESKDVATVVAKVKQGNEELENLAIIFEEQSKDLVKMTIGWDKTRAEMLIKIK